MHICSSWRADVAASVGEPAHEIGMDRALRQHAGPAGRQSGTGRPCGPRRSAISASNTAATRIAPRSCGVVSVCSAAGSGVERTQSPFDRRCRCALRSASPAPGGVAELDRQLAEHGVRAQVTRGCAGSGARAGPAGRSLEQGDDVGERLVERQHVEVGRLGEAAVHAVEDRVRRLVGDDVVGQAGVHAAAGHAWDRGSSGDRSSRTGGDLCSGE